jgi:hypothetical protein
MAKIAKEQKTDMLEGMLDDLCEYRNICWNGMLDHCSLEGLALMDILTDIHTFIFDVDLPPKARIFLLEKFATIEERRVYTLICFPNIRIIF